MTVQLGTNTTVRACLPGFLQPCLIPSRSPSLFTSVGLGQSSSTLHCLRVDQKNAFVSEKRTDIQKCPTDLCFQFVNTLLGSDIHCTTRHTFKSTYHKLLHLNVAKASYHLLQHTIRSYVLIAIGALMKL